MKVLYQGHDVALVLFIFIFMISILIALGIISSVRITTIIINLPYSYFFFTSPFYAYCHLY